MEARQVVALQAVAALAACKPGTGPVAERTSSTAAAPGTAAPDTGTSYADVVARVAPHVVTIRTGAGPGSGAVFRSDVVMPDQHVAGDQQRVVGISEAYLPPSTGAVSPVFAIPSSTAVDEAGQLLEDGTATHPYPGVSVGRLTEAVRERFDLDVERGALVLGVDENGPAAAAGPRAEDVLAGLAGREVGGVEDLLSALRGTEPGQRATAVVVRDGREQRVEIDVAARPWCARR